MAAVRARVAAERMTRGGRLPYVAASRTESTKSLYLLVRALCWRWSNSR
jgi:hypothetical protein